MLIAFHNWIFISHSKALFSFLATVTCCACFRTSTLFLRSVNISTNTNHIINPSLSATSGPNFKWLAVCAHKNCFRLYWIIEIIKTSSEITRILEKIQFSCTYAIDFCSIMHQCSFVDDDDAFGVALDTTLLSILIRAQIDHFWHVSTFSRIKYQIKFSNLI